MQNRNKALSNTAATVLMSRFSKSFCVKLWMFWNKASPGNSLQQENALFWDYSFQKHGFNPQVRKRWSSKCKCAVNARVMPSHTGPHLMWQAAPPMAQNGASRLHLPPSADKRARQEAFNVLQVSGVTSSQRVENGSISWKPGITGVAGATSAPPRGDSLMWGGSWVVAGTASLSCSGFDPRVAPHLSVME